VNAQARYFLRAAIAAVLAGLGAAGGALVDGGLSPIECVTIATATLGAAGAWLGVGAAVPQVEPHIGNKLDG
jgi:hypothetical protein